MGLFSKIGSQFKKKGSTPESRRQSASKKSHIQEAQSSLAPPTRRGGFKGGLVSYKGIGKLK